MSEIALQLYSVGHEAETDFYGTLKKTAAIGYNGVEFAGYYGYSAAEMKRMLTELGLNAVSSHCNALENIADHIKYMNELGAMNIVVPHHPFSDRESVLRFADEMNQAGRVYKENGLMLGYHNHSHEFKKDENGEYLFDVFYHNTDPEFVSMQMDVCWVTVAREDPIAYLKKYANRSRTVHLKEVKTIEPYMGTTIGKGIIDFKGIYEVLGLDMQYIVEQETIGEDLWEALEESVSYLKRNFT